MENKRGTTYLLGLVLVSSLASSNGISLVASSNAISSNANGTSFSICAYDCDGDMIPPPTGWAPPCSTAFRCPLLVPPSSSILPSPQFPPSPTSSLLPPSPPLPSSTPLPPSPPLSCSKCNKRCRRRGYDYGSCSFRPKCVCKMHSKGTPVSPPIGK